MATAAAMASKNLSRCAEVSLGAKFSRTLLGIEALGSPKGAWVWQRCVRLCWTRRSPLVSAQVTKRNDEKLMVGESSREITQSKLTGMLGLDQSFRSGRNPRASTQRGRRFPRSAVLDGEYQLSSTNGSSFSEAAGVNRSEESKESNDELPGSSTVSQETSALEKLTSGSTQRWFPYDDCFKLDEDRQLTSSEVISMLSPFIIDERKERMKEVVAHRTYSVCIAVEALLDLGNISAVCRTADALGFQSIHVISNETRRKYKKNRKVSMGTEKWLDAELWDNTNECIATLRKRGYRIAVTHIAPDTVPIHDIDWTIPTAVIFGNELQGASEEAIRQSDIRCCIPMAGMVESFNISVAAGILMHHATRDRITRSGTHGDIAPQDRQILEAEFYLRHNRHTVPLIDCLLEKKAKGGVGPPIEIFNEDYLASMEEPAYSRSF